MVLHGGIVHVSTAANVFQPQMGRIVTAAQVSQAHLSRDQIGAMVANQFRGAFSAFTAGLNRALDDLATSGDREAFDADAEALSDGLAARCAEILSTSPRAASSLTPFCQDAINGSGPDSLVSRLTALSIDSSDPAAVDASRSGALGLVGTSLRGMLGAIGTFAQNPNFRFSDAIATGGGTGGGGSNNPPPTPPPSRPPAAPTNLNAVTVSPSRIDLSWTGSTGAAGYKLERSTNGVDWTQVAATPANTTTFIDTALTPGTNFSYRVRASSSAGDSAFSPTIGRATVPEVLPDMPQSVLLSPLRAGHEGLAMHIHPTLRIFIDGQEQVIPANTGITSAGLFPLHLHDEPGLLHVEANEPFTFRLKDFFEVWGFTTNDPTKVFNQQQFLGRPIDANHRITVTVNDQPSDALENTTLNNPDGSLFGQDGTRRIVIRYETLPGA